MTYTKKQVLPALHDSNKVKDPDLTDVGERNYTSTILKYANLSLPFSQLDTNAKRVVPAINELYNNRVIANPPIPSGSGYVITSEDGEIILSEDDYIITSDGEGGGDADPLNTIKIDGIVYKIVGGGGGVYYLKDLNDVNIQSPTSGQTLRYDSATERWINVDGGGDYTAGVGIYFTDNSVINAEVGRKSPLYTSLQFKSNAGSDWEHLQWEDSGTTIDGHTVYQTHGNTYQTLTGKSLCEVDFSGFSDITVYFKQESPNTNYQYLVLGDLNQDLSEGYSDYAYTTKDETPTSDWISYSFSDLYGGSGFFQLLYEKDAPPPVPGAVTVNLNNGQWRDSGTTLYGNTVYESDVGSYQIDDGKSICTLQFEGLTSITLHISNDSENYYDYVYVGYLDENVSISNYYERAQGYNLPDYKEVTIICSAEPHTIQIMYAKDGSFSKGNDRGYFYFTTSSTPIDSYRAYMYFVPSEPYSKAVGEIFNDYDNNFAIGDYTHAEGGGTFAGSYCAHAEGGRTIASGIYSHAEGDGSKALGSSSHAEGCGTYASGEYAHAEGQDTQAINEYTHAEGHNTIASGSNSHAEGYLSVASGANSHAEGKETQAKSFASHAEGLNTISSGEKSHAEGELTQAIGNNSHAEGEYSQSHGLASHAEGFETKAIGEDSHAEGSYSESRGNHSHAEGKDTIAYGVGSHAEGGGVYAFGHESHAEGGGTLSVGNWSHTEGAGNQTLADRAHIEGAGNKNTGLAEISHIEGASNTAYGEKAHIEGSANQTSGEEVHAEGAGNQVHGDKSHIEGGGNIAYAIGSHIEGKHNVAVGFAQHIEGADNSVGVTAAPNQFMYGTSYAEGDIVAANYVYARRLGDERNPSLIYRCKTAPGQIQESSNIRFITPQVWNDSTAYPAGSVVVVKNYSYLHTFYYCTSAVDAGVFPPSNSGGSSYSWYRIKDILSPFANYTFYNDSYCLLNINSEFSGNTELVAVVNGTIKAMWEPITIASYSHIEGQGNIGTGYHQHIEGKYNVVDDNKAFIIGNGTDSSHRSNAVTIDWQGNTNIAGDLTVGVALSTTAQTVGAAINELAAGGGGGGSVSPIPNSFIYSLFN